MGTRGKGLSAFQLKIIACISMLIDHITYVFIPEESEPSWMGVSIPYLVGRCIGRTAFIILAFLLVEGFFYSKNRKKYLLRLGIAAFIAEPVFDYMCEIWSFPACLGHQNVLFLFALGLILLSLLETVRECYYIKSRLKYNAFSVFFCVLGFLIAHFLNFDYGEVGIGLILIFYFMRGARKGYVALMVFVWSLISLGLSHMLEWAGLIALIPIFMYKGEKGKDARWAFYAFYPLHMLVLILLYKLI